MKKINNKYTENETYHVISDIKTKDYFHYNTFCFYKSFNGVLMVSLGVLFIFLEFILITLILSNNISIKKIDFPIIFMFIYILIIFIITPIYLDIKSIIIVRKNPFITEEKLFKFQPLHINVISKSLNIILKWEEITKITESRYAYYFFISKNKAFILPKRFFYHYKDELNFINFIKKYADHKKINLKN